MVAVTGFDSLDALIDATVPKAIRRPDMMDLGEYTSGMRESEFLKKFKCAPRARPAPRSCARAPDALCLSGSQQRRRCVLFGKRQSLLRRACWPSCPGARQRLERLTGGLAPPWSVSDVQCPACCPLWAGPARPPQAAAGP